MDRKVPLTLDELYKFIRSKLGIYGAATEPAIHGQLVIRSLTTDMHRSSPGALGGEWGPHTFTESSLDHKLL